MCRITFINKNFTFIILHSFIRRFRKTNPRVFLNINAFRSKLLIFLTYISVQHNGEYVPHHSKGVVADRIPTGPLQVTIGRFSQGYNR